MKQDSSLNLELTDWLGWLASKLRRSYLRLPSIGITSALQHARIPCGLWDPYSGPRAYTAGTYRLNRLHCSILVSKFFTKTMTQHKVSAEGLWAEWQDRSVRFWNKCSKNGLHSVSQRNRQVPCDTTGKRQPCQNSRAGAVFCSRDAWERTGSYRPCAITGGEVIKLSRRAKRRVLINGE